MEEPIRALLRSDKVLPRITNARLDSEAPKREKLLIESEDPN